MKRIATVEEKAIVKWIFVWIGYMAATVAALAINTPAVYVAWGALTLVVLINAWKRIRNDK
jgi:phage gp37-like protein